MFANRFTVFVDACVLAGALKRNLVLSLAEAEFCRLRWSRAVLDETEKAISHILARKGDPSPDDRARKSRMAMEAAFEEAEVSDFNAFEAACAGLPDQGDIHVLAAALKTRADVLVTENLKDFPVGIVADLGIEVKSADDFIADTIELDPGRAVAAIKRMRKRLRRPELDAEDLINAMDAAGLTESVNALQPYTASL